MLVNKQEIFLPSPPGSTPQRLSVDPLRAGAAVGGGRGGRAPTVGAGGRRRGLPQTIHFRHRGNFPHPEMLSQSLRQEISRNLLTTRMTRPPTVAAHLCSHYGLCHTWPTPTTHTEEARGQVAEGCGRSPSSGGTNCLQAARGSRSYHL